MTPGSYISLELPTSLRGSSLKVKDPMQSPWVRFHVSKTPDVNLIHAGLPWTQLMDCALYAAHTELKATQEDVLKAICSTPFHADMIQAWIVCLGVTEWNVELLAMSEAFTSKSSGVPRSDLGKLASSRMAVFGALHQVQA